jgi:predicted membrane protein
MFGGTDSVFSMIVTNLYYVLLAIYAYLGAQVIISAVSKNRSTFFAFLMIVIGFLLLGTTAAALLAVIGTYTSFVARVDTEKANKD